MPGTGIRLRSCMRPVGEEMSRSTVAGGMDAGAMQFPISAVRASFPALNRGDNFIFFDNAVGAQVPRVVFDAVNKHLLECNVQRGGRYPKSLEVDSTITRARESVAIFVNARHPSEIAFGMNATSFIRIISLAIAILFMARMLS